MNKFSGVFFIIWVILPTAAGLACRYLLTPPRVATAASWFTLASAAALLLLNYINSALALAEMRDVAATAAARPPRRWPPR